MRSLQSLPLHPLGEKKLTDIQRHCERCGVTGPHTKEEFQIPGRSPSATERVDLTGRQTTPQTAPIGVVPDTQRFRCKNCGYVSVVMGPDKTKDIFSDLQSGKDWVDPK